MTRHQRLGVLSVLALIGLVSGCGGGTTTLTPGPNSGQASFLEGTWKGPVTIHRDGLADTTGTTTWTFTEAPGTGQHSFFTAITIEHPWLPITTTSVSSAILPATPGGELSTHGSYASPRGCQGQFSGKGKAMPTVIETHLEGADCTQLPETAVFSGAATLTKVR